VDHFLQQLDEPLAAPDLLDIQRPGEFFASSRPSETWALIFPVFGSRGLRSDIGPSPCGSL